MKKHLIWLVLTAFVMTSLNPKPVRADLTFLPAVGEMVPLTPSFTAPTVRGFQLHKDNPFTFDFILDTGDSDFESNSEDVKAIGKRLAGYFLAALTIPEGDMWVNLSPYEKNKIIPMEFGDTEMGKELLAQDYVLKQVAASLMYPEGPTGKEFWHKIYNEAASRLGTNNVPVDTLNKVWVVPSKAVVYENAADNSVVIIESRLKVMLEEDYTGIQKSGAKPNPTRALSKDMLRMIILPVLEKEVNYGKNFASLRQVYNSLILASWYKNKLKRSILGQAYIDRKKTAGIDVEDKDINKKIYQQYLEAFRKGVYNYIKEEVDPVGNGVVLRKYFSGGMNMVVSSKLDVQSGTDAAQIASKKIGPKSVMVTVGLLAALSAAPMAGSPGAQAATLNFEGPNREIALAGVESGDTLSQIIEQAASRVGRRMSYAQIDALIKTPGAVEVKDARGQLIAQLNPNTIYPRQNIRINLAVTPAPDANRNAAQPEAAGAPPDPPPVPAVVQEPVRSGDTVTSIFRNSRQMQVFRDNLGANRFDVRTLIENRLIQINDSNGVAVANPDLNRIYPGQQIVFNVGSFAEQMGNAVTRGVAGGARQGGGAGGDGGTLPPPADVVAVTAVAPGPSIPPAVPVAPVQNPGGAPEAALQLAGAIQAAAEVPAGAGGNDDIDRLMRTLPELPEAAALIPPEAPGQSEEAMRAFRTQQQAAMLRAMQNERINYGGTETQIRRDETARQNFARIQTQLFGRGTRVMGIIGSIDRNNLHGQLRVIQTEEQLRNLLYDEHVEVVAKAVPLGMEPADLADIRNERRFPTIPASAIQQYERSGRPFITVVRYRDDNGATREGILWAGEEAARAKVALMRSAMRDSQVQNALIRVLGVTDPNEQRRLLATPEMAELFRGAAIPAAGLLTTAKVIPDQWGNIRSVERFITDASDEIGVERAAMPLPRVRFVRRDGNGGSTELQYVSSRSGVSMMFTEVSAEKARLLSGPDGRQYLDQFVETVQEVMQQPRFFLGPNRISLQMAQSEFARYAAEQEAGAVNRRVVVERGRLRMTYILDALTLGMGAMGIPGGGIVHGVANLAYDAANPVRETLTGPIEEGRKDELVGWVLYSLQNSANPVTFEAWRGWQRSNPQVYEEWKRRGNVFRTSGMSERQVAEVDSFLRSRMNEALIGRFMSTVAQVVPLAGQVVGSFLNSNGSNTQLAAALTQRYFSLNGDFNLTALAAPNFVSIQDLMRGGAQPTQLLQFVGLSVNIRSIINAFDRDPLNRTFITAPSTVRLNISLPFLPLTLLWEIDNLETLKRLYEDPNVEAIVVEDGLLRSRSYGFTSEEMRRLSAMPGEARISAARVGNGQQQFTVPVYVHVGPDGKQTVLVLKANAIQRTIDELRRQHQTFTDYQRASEVGAITIQTGPEGGTLRQNNARGLYQSYSQAGQIFFPLGKSNDQFMVALRAIASNDQDIAKNILAYYYDHMRANMRLGAYAGAPESVNVQEGRAAPIASREATALFGLALQRFHAAHPTVKINDQENLTASQQVTQALQAIQEVLIRDATDGKIENGDVAAYMFAFFDRMGHRDAANYILRGVVNGLWDANAHLLRYKSSQPGFASATTLLWMRVLGPERFMQAFLGGSDRTTGLVNVIRSMYHTFGTNNGPARLLDAADSTLRAGRAHVGFIDETAGMVQVMNAILNAQLPTPLSAEERRELQAGAAFYTRNLRSVQDQRRNGAYGIAEAERSGIQSGKGYFTAHGAYALGAYLAVETMRANVDLLRAGTVRASSLPALPRVSAVPAEAQGRTDVVAADRNERRRVQERALRQRAQELRGRPAADGSRVEYVDPTNAEEIVTVQDGVVQRRMLVASPGEVRQELASRERNAAGALRQGQAVRAEGELAGGGVTIRRVGAGNTVGERVRVNGQDVLGTRYMQQIMEQVRRLPSLEQHRIERQQYSNFAVDLNMEGLRGRFVVSFVFPENRESVLTISDPDSGARLVEVYNKDGREVLTVSPTGITVREFNNLGIESRAYVYRNTFNHERESANTTAYVAKIRDMLNNRSLTLDGESWTVQFRHATAASDTDILSTRMYVDYRDGTVEARSYGVHAQPLRVVTRNFITENRFNRFGRLQESRVYDNNAPGARGALTTEQLRDIVQNPVQGTLRFINTTTIADTDQNLSRFNFNTTIQRQDVVHGTVETLLTDSQGRIAAIHHGDQVNTIAGTPQTLNYITRFTYRPDFYGGRVPLLSTKINAATGQVIQISQTESFDPTTQVSVVRETNTRTGAVVVKTIEPAFGQTMSSVETDPLGRTVETANDYSHDQLTMTSTTRINGVVARTTRGAYDRQNRQWRLSQERWSEAEGERFVQEVVETVLTARGHLLQEDTVYPDTRYANNGVEYREDNRRYVPEYDAQDNITRITEGVVDGAGNFTPQQYTDFSDYGDFFAARRSSTTRIIDGEHIVFTTGRLLTTPEEYRRTGRLDNELTSMFNDQWIETRDRDGVVLGKRVQARGAGGTVIGERVTEYNPQSFNAQNRPTSSRTFIVQNNMQTEFAVSRDVTSPQEARLGLVRTQIENRVNGLITQELRDRRGRIIENLIGEINAAGEFQSRRRTVLSDFNEYDIARNSFTDSMLNGNWQRYNTSRLISIEGGNIRFGVHNDFLSRGGRSIDWEETKNARGNLIELRQGMLRPDGTFRTTRLIRSEYAGIPSLLDIAAGTTAVMVDADGETGRITDQSRLMTAHGNAITDVDTVSVQDIYNEVGRVRYGGQRHHFTAGDPTTALQDYQEIRNGLGNVEITLLGHVNGADQFEPDRIEYRVYETDRELFGNFDIPTSTMTTNGQGQVIAFSNNTHITAEGLLSYNTQNGIGLDGLPMSEDLFANHRAVEQYLVANSHQVRIARVIRVVTTIKDELGREIFELSGFRERNPLTGFGAGQPAFMTINTYNPDQVSHPFSVDSRTYAWSERFGGLNGNGVPSLNDTAAIRELIAQRNPTVMGALSGLRIQDGMAVYTDVQDLRQPSLRSIALRLNGTLGRLYFEGTGVDGPANYYLHFDDNELPSRGAERLADGTERPHALMRNSLFQHRGIDYVLTEEFVGAPTGPDGRANLTGLEPSKTTLTHLGTTVLEQGRGIFYGTIRSTPYTAILDLNDMVNNSLVGQAARRTVVPSRDAEDAIAYGRQSRGTGNALTYTDDTSAREDYKPETWTMKAQKTATTVGALMGTTAAMYLAMAFLRLFGFSWTALFRRGKQDANGSQQQNFIDMGFTAGQANAILDERFQNGAFTSFADFKNRVENKIQNKLSENWWKRSIAKTRLSVAMWHMSKFKFGADGDANAFSAGDNRRLVAASTSVNAFMRELKGLYGVTADQETSYAGALKMFGTYLSPAELRDVVESTAYLSLVGRYNRQRAAEVILKLMFMQVRDTEAYKSAVRARVDDIIRSTGLDKEFPDQIAALRSTFLTNIENARLLPEGFQFHDFDIDSDLLAYSWDDLRKGPDMERQVRSNLVSIEKLFVFQVIFQRAMFGLAGQGRAEEYLWAKYIHPVINDREALRSADILAKIKAFKQVFHAIMLDEVKDRLENNRDPKGRVKYFQYVINEEIYNDAFRYLLGQKDPTLKDSGWVMPEDVMKRVAPLRDIFAGLLDQISTVNDQPADKRLAAVNELANKIKPVMKAFVAAVDQEIGMPVANQRMAYWKLTVIPILKMIKDKNMRERIFSRGGPYNQSAADFVRRLNHYAIVGTVTGMFAYLTANMVTLLPLMAVPSFVVMPWSLPVVIAAIVLMWAGSPFIKKKMVRTLDKKLSLAENKSPEEAKKAREKALKSFALKVKLLYGLQGALLLSSLLITPFVNLPTLMFEVPTFLKWALFGIPILIFIDTWRLSFYAVNYLLAGMAEHNYYVTNNVYELKTKNTKKLAGRLMALFTDKAPAFGSMYATRGQERLDSFVNVVEEMTSDEDAYFYANNIAVDGKSKLTDVLINLAQGLYDAKGNINQANAEALKRELEAFVAQVNARVSVTDASGKVYKASRHKAGWLNSLSVFLAGEDRPGLQKLIDYVNHNYRLDKGADPLTWDHVLPMTLAIHGYGEDWYFTNNELLEAKKAEGESEEFTHRIGILARYRTELFLNMIRRLTAEGSNERAELLKMIDNPTYVPEGIKTWAMWPEITEWVNRQLPTGYNNSVTQKRTLQRLYMHYGRIFDVENPQFAAEEKIRVIDRNLMAMDALDKVLGGKLREVVDVLLETNYTSTHIVYPDGTEKGILDPFALIDAKAPADGKYDRITLRKMMDLVITDRLFPVRLMGGGLNTSPLAGENYHGAKWNQKTAILPFLVGPVLLNIDADHRGSYADMEFIANHLLEYHYMPGLATSTPVIKLAMTKGFGVFGDILPVSESAFGYHAQQGKELLGGLTAYGKFFERISALRHSEGVTDSYVAEDSVTALNYARFGYVVGRAGAVKIDKGWPYAHAVAVTPERKWSYNMVESTSGRTALKTIMSPLVSWPYLANNFWLDGFGFYGKKPGIIRYIRWLLPFYLILDWNLFSRIPMALWMGSLVLSQAISHGLFFFKIYDESRGAVRGTVSGVNTVATRMFTKFIHNVFMYNETVGKLSVNRLGRFISTASKGANMTRVLNKTVNYVRSRDAIKTASIFALVSAAVVGLSPLKAMFWAPILLMGVAGVAAPSLLNPVRIHNRLGDNIDNGKGIALAWWWGMVDNMEGMMYRLSGLLPYARKAEDDLQKRVLALVDALLPKPYADIPAGERAKAFDAVFGADQGGSVLELTEHVHLFHQDPGHYRKLYGRAAVPAIEKLMAYVIGKSGNAFEAKTPVNIDDLKAYHKDLTKRLAETQSYLESLKEIDDLKGRITSAENKELVEVSRILNMTDPTSAQLDRADWLLTQMAWLPLEMQAQSPVKSALANRIFGTIGVEAAVQAAAFYVFFPVLFVWDKMTRSKEISENYFKATEGPVKIGKPLDPAMTVNINDFTPALRNFSGAVASSLQPDAAQLTGAMVEALKEEDVPVSAAVPKEAAAVIKPTPDPFKKGGIDLSRTQVKVAGDPGAIRVAMDDPAMLRLLLNADGLKPIIYNIKPMNTAMIDKFVGI